MGSEKSPRWKSFRIAGCTVLAIVAFMAVATLVIRDRKPPIVFQINDEVSLRVVAILTQENPKFEILSWQARLNGWLPNAVRAQLRKFLKWNPQPDYSTSSKYGPGEFRLLLQPIVPPEWSRDASDPEQVWDKVNKALADAKLQSIRLQYGDGWYSDSKMMYTSGNTSAQFYGVNFTQVPKVINNLVVHFYNGLRYPPKPGKTFKIPNPVYREIAPLKNPSAMPVTVTHGGISVTLKQLADKTAQPGDRDSVGRGFKEVLQEGKVLKAPGTFQKPYNCTAVFEIADPGTSIPQWQIDSTAFHYGQELIQFTGGVATLPHVLATTGSISAQYITYPGLNLGVLNQPVKVTVDLVKVANWAPDEQVLVELPVPAKGAETDTRVEELWSGPVTLAAIDGGHFRRGNSSVSSSGSDFAVVADNAPKEMTISGIELIAADGQSVDLEDSDGGGSGNHFVYKMFDTSRPLMQNKSPKALRNYRDYTTISVMLTSPRPQKAEYEFVVEPTVATVPAATD